MVNSIIHRDDKYASEWNNTRGVSEGWAEFQTPSRDTIDRENNSLQLSPPLVVESLQRREATRLSLPPSLSLYSRKLNEFPTGPTQIFYFPRIL